MPTKTIGGYRILSEIASGGQGSVYRAWDAATGQVVALKTLNRHDGDGQSLERFRREALLTAAIDHPNVIRILDNGEEDDVHFIVMELLPANLRDVIESMGKLPIARAVDICRQAALGLQAANDHGVIHRDIKPGNLLIDSDGTTKVTDFGLARAEDLSTLTRVGVAMGTRGYMSPEQARGERVDTRSDIYSLGIVLYEMLTGTRSFDVENPKPVNQIRPGVPVAIAHVIGKCLENMPEARFQTPGDLVDEIGKPALMNRIALIDLYEATDGPNWEDNTNWLTDAPIGNWYGVTSPSNVEVTQLNLSMNGLMGKIPTSIAYLRELTDLILNNNDRLYGNIPASLWNLRNLRDLNLVSTNLTGQIPPDIGSLVNLEELWIVGFSMSGDTLGELCNLRKLKSLYLYGTDISGEIPPELGNLTNLKWLHLTGNNLSGEIPPELGNLTNLKWLQLGGNKFTGCIPAGLRHVRYNDLSKLNLPFCVP